MFKTSYFRTQFIVVSFILLTSFFVLSKEKASVVNTKLRINNAYQLNVKYILRRGYIRRFQDLSSEEIIKIFSAPFFGQKLKKRVIKFLPLIFEKAIKFNVDPFWAFSIAMVESHFKPRAMSNQRAHGLFQVKGSTAVYLKKLLKDKTYLNIYKPEENIELGVYYLAKLKKRFKSGTYATVAYNMGPTWVARQLRNKRRVGNRNKYLNKVKKVYYLVVGRYRKIERRKINMYKNTLAYSEYRSSKKRNFIDQFFGTFLVNQRLLAYNY